MCNPAVIPSYEKTLATINNKTKGWLIVPFQVPQGVQNKKKHIKTKNHLAFAHNRYTEFKT